MTTRLRRTLLWVSEALFLASLVFYIGALLGLFTLARPTFSWQIVLWLVVFCPLIMWAAVAVHELGHVISGALMGCRVRSVHVWPWLFEFGEDGLRLRWSPAGPVFSGLTRHDVTIPSDNLRRQYVVMVAGGPLFSLLAGVLLGGLCLAYLPGRNESGASAFWLGLAAVATLRPFFEILPGWRDHPSDGTQIMDWVFASARTEKTLVADRLCTDRTAGKRPRDWDAALVARLLHLRDESEDDFWANFLGYCHALDCRQFERAGKCLDLALTERASFPGSVRAELLLEAAYFTAAFRHEPGTAREWLDQAPSDGSSTPLRLRAEAAVLLAEGDPTGAEALARQGLNSLPRACDRGTVRIERESLRTIVAACGKHAGAQPTKRTRSRR